MSDAQRRIQALEELARRHARTLEDHGIRLSLVEDRLSRARRAQDAAEAAERPPDPALERARQHQRALNQEGR